MNKVQSNGNGRIAKKKENKSQKKCLICGGTLKSHVIPGLVKCGCCGFVTTNMKLSIDEIKKLYSSSYYNGEEYADYITDKSIIQKNFKKRLKRMKRHIPDMQKKALFEIGCAYGFFLEIAEDYFKSVEGIDISGDAVRYAREKLGLNASAGDFAEVVSDKKYDVICMWDTIEHLQNPAVYIEKAGKLLKNEGFICITTGDIGSLNAKIRGSKWRQIHPPTHLHYFSRDTLGELLSNHGFRVVDVSYPANSLSINTVLYTILCLRSNNESLYNFLKRTKITQLTVGINLLDFMFVIAKKVEK